MTYLVAMVTRYNTSITYIVSWIEFIFGMEVLWDNRHQPHTSLLWKLGCHGNQSEISITHLS